MSSEPDPSKPSVDEVPLDPVTEEALTRLVHLHSGAETEDDRADYEAWKSAGPEHAAAGERAERLWTMMGPALAGRRIGRKAPKAGIVAVALVGAGLLAFASGLFGPPEAYFADERTGIGEIRTLVLADGSMVTLDTRTSLDVADGGRHLTLHTGQIFVEVAPDPSRGFVVESGDGRAEALGTAFNLRLEGGATAVTVAESRVRVTFPDAAGRAVVEVAAGETVTYSEEGGTGTPRAADVVAGTAWRRGELRFAERPLGEVLAEIGRYRRGAVVFADDALRRLPVTGVFDLDEPEALLDAVELALPVRVRRLPFLTVIERRRQTPSGG